MIDTKELRRLAQAATPGPWIGCGPSFGESLPKYLNEVVVDREGDEDDGYSICNTPIGLDEELSTDMAFIAAANPAVINELLDRLEAAEAEALEEARLNGMGSEREAALMAKLEAAEKERDNANAATENIALKLDYLRSKLETAENAQNDWLRANAPGGWIDNLRVDNEALRAEVIHIKEVEFPRKAQAVADGWRGKCERLEAKIAEMERQEPVGKFIQHPSNGIWEQDGYGDNPDARPLYALPGSQPAIEKLCYDSRWEILIDYVDGWNAAVDMMRGKSPSWHCPDCCIAFPFGAPKSCPNDDARCNSLLAAAPEAKP